MTLQDYLELLSDDEYVYLGCKSGSGWIFNGTVCELLENLDKLDDAYKKKAWKSMMSDVSRSITERKTDP